MCHLICGNLKHVGVNWNGSRLVQRHQQDAICNLWNYFVTKSSSSSLSELTIFRAGLDFTTSLQLLCHSYYLLFICYLLFIVLSISSHGTSTVNMLFFLDWLLGSLQHGLTDKSAGRFIDPDVTICFTHLRYHCPCTLIIGRTSVCVWIL